MRRGAVGDKVYADDARMQKAHLRNRHDWTTPMKYCLFCRESFEDEMLTCPYCSDELADELPDEGCVEQPSALAPDAASEATPEEAAVPPEVLMVAVLGTEEDLKAAVDVLKELDIYFEIESIDGFSGITGMRTAAAWRLLVEADNAREAFLALVDKIPHAFPRSVVEWADADRESGKGPQTADPPSDPAGQLRRILAEPLSDLAALEVAKLLIEAFSGPDAEAIAMLKGELARKAPRAAPVIAEVAAEAISMGGEGAERVLFHCMQVLEAVGFDQALSRVEPHYASGVAQVRTRAAYAAGRLGNTDAVDALLDLLEDPDEDVRYEASESIWRLTGFDFDFEPHAQVPEEAAKLAALREMWAERRTSASVRSRTKLADIFKGLNNPGA